MLIGGNASSGIRLLSVGAVVMFHCSVSTARCETLSAVAKFQLECPIFLPQNMPQDFYGSDTLRSSPATGH